MKNQLSSRVIDFDPKADDVLLHAVRGGDQQAFGILVERYQPKEEAFEDLDGPILPYSPPLEEHFLPNAEKVAPAARELAKY